MLVEEFMTVHPVCIFEEVEVRHACAIISSAEISELMVIDKNHNFVGVLSEGDLLRAILPDFEEILAAGGTLEGAFSLFVSKGARLASYPIAPLIIRRPFTASCKDEAAQVAALMLQKQIRRLPVVENNRLIGTVSRSDLCRAVIYNTQEQSEDL